MKVHNKNIARAVFLKIYYSKENKETCQKAALRLASGIFRGEIRLGLGDVDWMIDSELYKFGCHFDISRDGDIASFDMNGQTNIHAKKWKKMTEDIPYFLESNNLIIN